jgi:hypothetical protein
MKLPLRMGSEEARRFGNQALPQTPFHYSWKDGREERKMEGWEGGKKDKTKPRTLKSLIGRDRYGLKLRHFCGSSSGVASHPLSLSTPNANACCSGAT